MDSTGAEIKDVIEAATEEDAQATIRQMGYFVTKISVKKSRKKAEAGRRQEEARLRLRRRQIASTSPRSPASSRSSRTPACRFSARSAFSPSRPSPGRLKYSLEDTCEAIEGGDTLSEAMAKIAQVLRPPLRQHDQGRRSGRRPRSHSPASRRLQGTRRVAQAQSQIGDDLPGRRRHGRRRHLDVHHDQDRAQLSGDLRRLRPRAPAR